MPRLFEKEALLGFPDVGRSGLGNTLFPWARCFLWCREQRVPMVAPIWFRLRLGPYLRREKDKRAYHRLFTSSGYVSGVERLAALATLPRLPEPPTASARPQGRGLAQFTGMGSQFAPLRGHSSALADELSRITRPHLLPAPRRAAFLAVHVRRGDFSTPSSETILTSGRHNYRIATEWYVEALRCLRSALGRDVPAVIYSDGLDSELVHLLGEPNVARSSGKEAITDILDMSRASALVASGSTFSMWASFLGQVPSIWYPGQRRQLVLGDSDCPALEPEWDSGPLPNELVLAASRRPLL